MTQLSKAESMCPQPIIVPGGEKVYDTGYVCFPCVWCGKCVRGRVS